MKKYIVVFVMAIMVIYGYSVTAQAAVYDTLTVVKAKTLPLQVGPSKNTDIIAVLQKGDVVSSSGDVVSGWLQVRTTEGVGYVNNSQVESIGWTVAPYEVRFTMYKLTTGLSVERGNTYADFERGDFMYRSHRMMQADISNADDIPQAFLTRIPPTIRETKKGSYFYSEPTAASYMPVDEFTLDPEKEFIPANTPVESYGVCFFNETFTR